MLRGGSGQASITCSHVIEVEKSASYKIRKRKEGGGYASQFKPPSSDSFLLQKSSSLKFMAPKREAGITIAEGNELKRMFPDYIVRAPHAHETPRSKVEGELCLHADYFKCGLRLPIQEPIQAFLRYYQMVPAMLTPNTFAVLLGLHKWFQTCGLRWTAENIMSLITIVQKGTGLYFAQVRCGLTFAMKGLPPYSHGWDKRYAFFRHKSEAWGIPTVVNDIDAQVFKKYSVSKEVGDIYTSYTLPFMCLDVKNNSISFVREVKKKPDGKKVSVVEVDNEVNVEEDVYDMVTVETRRQPDRAAKRSRLETIPEGLLMLEGPPTVSQADAAISEVVGQVIPAITLPQPENLPSESSGKETPAVIAPTSAPREMLLGEGSGDPNLQTARERLETSTSEEDIEIPLVIDGTKDHYVDVEHQVLVSRLDNVKRFIPEMELSDVPAAMIASLSHSSDYEMMLKMNDEALVQLQAQKAFGSCMVARHIAGMSEDRRLEANKQRARADEALRIGKELKDNTEILMGQIRDLIKEADASKALVVELTNEKEIMSKRIKDLREVYDTEKTLYDEKITTLQQELNVAKYSNLATKKKEDAERKSLEDRVQFLKDSVDKLREERDAASKVGREWKLQLDAITTSVPPATVVVSPPMVSAPSYSQIIEEYKNSDEYTAEMRDVGDDAFRVLKLALIADGKLAKEDMKNYDLEKCFDRDAEGEFTDLL